MARKKLTLNVEADLIVKMKIQAIKENRDLSTITEECYREYLKGSIKSKN